MLENIFTTVLNMSITATVATIVIILIRLFFNKKLPKIFSYVLWVVVLVRLLIPFSFSSNFSIFNILPVPETTIITQASQSLGTIQYIPNDIGIMQTPKINTGMEVINKAVNKSIPLAAPQASVNPMQIKMFIYSLIWILGFVSLFMFSLITYICTLKRLKTAVLYKDNGIISECCHKLKLKRKVQMFISDRINTPVVCSLIKPRIILPLSIIGSGDETAIKHIIIHELIHIKRCDYIIKPLSVLALCIHWFNPVIWLSFILSQKDMEISCDERVISVSGSDIRSDYAALLINLSVKQNTLLNGGFLAFGESNIKGRVKGIMNYKKPRFWMTSGTIIILVVIGILLLSNSNQKSTFSDNNTNAVKDEIDNMDQVEKTISQYFLDTQPDNKGNLIIYNIKKHGNDYLALTEKYIGDGHSYSTLLLIDKGLSVIAAASGEMPISPCYTVNSVEYGGKTILYGNFKNKKWDSKKDIVVDAQIDNMEIKFEDGTVIKESVSIEKGYIIIAPTTSRLTAANLYNNKDELQSCLDETLYRKDSFSKIAANNIKDTEITSSINLGDISKIEVYHSFFNNFDKNYKPTVLKDKALVQQVCEMLESSSLAPQNDKINNMSGMKSYLNKLVLFKADGSRETIPFTYDDLYNVGYIEYQKEKLYPSYDFFRYLSQMDEFRNISSDVDSVKVLFNQFGYTPCFKISSVERTLPKNLLHRAGEYPEKLYWAYNNELSKEIGFDMIPYLGEKVTCEIYYLQEPLPQFMKPRLNARGIVIKHQGQIIGAYLDSGRHYGFAAALDGKAFKDITKKVWEDWITDYIDYDDPLEKTISSMTPEELINTYYKAQGKDDDKLMFACMSRKNIVNWLFMNMDNNKLFNDSLNDARSGNKSYIDTVKILEIKELKNNTNIKEYKVILDLKVRNFATSSNGKQPRIVQLVKEGQGWRIEGEGN